MLLLDWNVNFRSADSLSYIDTMPVPPDIVCLQEVTVSRAESFVSALKARGLPHVHSSINPDATEKRYGNLIASAWPLVPQALQPNPLLRWPQLIAHALVATPAGPLHVITVHVPNAAGNGWAKVDTFDYLYELLAGLRGQPVILVGDFNEPQYAVQDDRVVTFAQDLKDDGRYVAGRPYRGHDMADWDASVRRIFEADDDLGLRHAYWATAGVGSLEPTHINRGDNRWLDHAFVSKHVSLQGCRYDHSVREALDLSDHSVLLLEFEMHPA